MKKPYIICSAVWFDDGNVYVHKPKNIETGIVVCGRRHHDCFYIPYVFRNEQKIVTADSRPIQGFLTSNNYFVDRKRAAEIAYESGQITELKNELYSEDIY